LIGAPSLIRPDGLVVTQDTLIESPAAFPCAPRLSSNGMATKAGGWPVSRPGDNYPSTTHRRRRLLSVQ
jgi:hypothetical protein